MTDEPRNPAMLRFLNEAFAEDSGWQAYVDDFYFGEDTAFLPLSPAEAERQRADMNRVAEPPTQAQLDKFLNEMYPSTFRWRMPFPTEET